MSYSYRTFAGDPVWSRDTKTVYRVEKQNLQVAKLVNFEHVNENMAQNSSPTSKHNLFALIQGKKLFVKCLGI